jgi:predicted nucleotidyltransferase
MGLKEKFADLSARLREAEGENLLAVIVYGSALAVPGGAKRSDYEWLIVLRRFNAVDLRRVGPVIHALVEAGYALPSFFSERELRDSLDVFPIEFRQMKRTYEVVYGQDVLANLEASPANLRRQVEYELRAKMLRLRSLFLPASQSPERLQRLMTDSVGSFVHVLRPILELLGEDPPVERRAAAARVGERLGVDLAPILRILTLRDEPVSLLEVEIQDLFSAYLDCLGAVIEAIDKLPSGR